MINLTFGTDLGEIGGLGCGREYPYAFYLPGDWSDHPLTKYFDGKSILQIRDPDANKVYASVNLNNAKQELNEDPQRIEGAVYENPWGFTEFWIEVSIIKLRPTSQEELHEIEARNQNARETAEEHLKQLGINILYVNIKPDGRSPGITVPFPTDFRKLGLRPGTLSEEFIFDVGGQMSQIGFDGKRILIGANLIQNSPELIFGSMKVSFGQSSGIYQDNTGVTLKWMTDMAAMNEMGVFIYRGLEMHWTLSLRKNGWARKAELTFMTENHSGEALEEKAAERKAEREQRAIDRERELAERNAEREQRAAERERELARKQAEREARATERERERAARQAEREARAAARFS